MRPIRKRPKLRKGAIIVLAAILSIVLVGMVAFSVDVGYVLSAKEELQRTADAAALAACWDFGQQLSDGNSAEDAAQVARLTALEYAQLNAVTGKPLQLDPNSSNTPDGDVVFGHVTSFDSGGAFQPSYPSLYNAVRLRVHKDEGSNGEVPYYFARIFGVDGQVLQTEATAALVSDVKGFRAPSDGSNLELLPFALDLETWTVWVAGSGSDDWQWNPDTKQVQAGSDGMLEINLYPQGTGSPGNRGTVDIGSNNNSTSDIARQIVDGVSAEDLAYHGGKLEFDANGKLYLNGDTGISAGVKDELASIISQPRIIPVFETVQGPGNNAEYTIVKWIGIRITDVKLTGPMSKKRVTIQSAPISTLGVIPSDTQGTSSYVYSPVMLVD